MPLADDELERYARHIVLHEIGGPGQQALIAARVAVVGAGGLGSPALLYLAAAGVGEITVIDDDRVSLSNLQRQVLHRDRDVGRPKVESAVETLGALNPSVKVTARDVRLDAANAQEILAGQDLVLDGCDGFETRRLVNETCAALRIPLVSGAIGRWEGQVSVFRPWLGGPCYACLFPEAPSPDQVPACAEAGVLGALAGMIGSLMASEAVKLIVGAGEPLDGRLLLWDALDAEARTIRVKKRAGCPVCGVED
ncbi:molybdopterin-synthase adenylyltransferase MoeB [Albimonas sp. CAU 1670]|uniref:HesA/MoeB/ThiF family protein n=1 Tax=Albimonas sp. CAU 1670 TaxID=3032599 RepID=UPI0023DACD24|nr:molybdopterin-synthase adenylyltransferase MoeB [Albimonas sp. CAU 1670]MDF2233247.1 molybdopterin-synthase adenylyltransferase MoeB [Albimonas sp. CAU 1670]